MNELQPMIGRMENDPERVMEPIQNAPKVKEPCTRGNWPAFWVLIIFLCIHIFIFRGVVAKLPDLMAGHSVLNTGELVPFFDPSSQFIEQLKGSFSELTEAYEFRVRYSVLTTWMRYYLILPFAIILAPCLGAFFACLAISCFLRSLLPSIPSRRILSVTALTTLLIHFILLSAKITHFYTLILGFDVFVISFTFLLRGLLLETQHPRRMLLLASILALVNPGVHYLVLYPITVVFFCIGTALLLLITGNAKKEGMATTVRIWKRILLALVYTLFFTLVPYALFVRFFVLRGYENLSDAVPDSVTAIISSSLPLLHQMTFDISSVTENYLRGGYISPVPHYAKLFYFLLAIVPFILSATHTRQEQRRLQPFLILIGILMLFSMWCSVGFAPVVLIPTFHTILAVLFSKLYLVTGPLAEGGMRIISETIHVLRYPDRFQFIFLTTITLLMPLGILSISTHCTKITQSIGQWGRRVATVICIIAFFIPFFAHWEYRSALLTGDFGGFLRPYSVLPLREIKTALEELPRGKTIVLPPGEGPWVGESSKGEYYQFVDKFFIYFLNSPSYYFGPTGDPENRYWFFLLFESLSRNEHWWINVFRKLDIRYLILNKELDFPSRSQPYLHGIAQAIAQQPQVMRQYFRRVKENDSFVLFEFIDPAQKTAQPILLDTDWKTFQCMLERSLTLTRDYQILSLNSQRKNMSGTTLHFVVTDVKKARLDLYVRENKTAFFRPDQSSFAFNPDHLPNSEYFGMMLPMLNLLTESSYNIMRTIMAGSFDTFTTSFVGLLKPTSIRFPITVPKSGTYEVLLRSIPTQHQFAVRLDDGPITSITVTPSDSSTYYVSTKSVPFSVRSVIDPKTTSIETLQTQIPNTIMPVGDAFSYVSLGILGLTEGDHKLYLTKNDTNPLIIEGVLLLPIQKKTQDPPLRQEPKLLTPDSLNK